MTFDHHHLSDFNRAKTLEWIETNGLGGYASSSVSGAHTRRYHGLLVASARPPVERCVVLSKLDETLHVNGSAFELSANQYPGTVHPQGYQHLRQFSRDLFPEFVFEAGGVTLRKTIAAVHGENTTLLLYEVMDAPGEFQLDLLPLSACRDFHSLSHENDSFNKTFRFSDGIFETKNYQGTLPVFISVPGSDFVHAPYWYHRFEYSVERYRGLDFEEDLFSHGKFVVKLKKGSRLGIIISTQDPGGRSAWTLFDREKERRMTLLPQKSRHAGHRRLLLAADQFIVKRGEDLKTIIAGYHWFSDWGRDTMISLPGLCLATGRYDDARKIIRAFAENISDGMLPNRFADYGEASEYNTVDATLWFFHAIHTYYRYTRDWEFVAGLLPVLDDIVAWHDKGTRYHIHTDTDGLLYAGEEGVQLTWMDAKVGDWVVTPRTGKAVEINALWYNALSVMAALHDEAGAREKAAHYATRAQVVSAAFMKLFWNEADESLFDCVDGDRVNRDFRPNQVYALSLPYPVVAGAKALKVLEKIEQKLLTPKGLRSLSTDHRDYRPNYGGNPWSRDGAYHEGTVWSFLLGPYVDALVRLKGKAGVHEAEQLVESFLQHLDEGAVGTVSEIFDAEAPHTPRGCVAQAWGVGEVLRVISEYDLFTKAKPKKKAASVI